MKRLLQIGMLGLMLGLVFVAPASNAVAGSGTKARWITKMNEFLNRNRGQFRTEHFQQLQRVAASGDASAFRRLVETFLRLSFDQAGFACNEHGTRHHCSEHCHMKHPSGFGVEVPRGICAAGCHADNKWFKPAFRDFGKWFEGAKKWVQNAVRDVKKEFDKAGKWLSTAIKDAGRTLKSLGQKVLDGLKKVGKDIAKGALRVPFHLYIEGNRAAYLRRAAPMTAAEKTEMLKHFPRHIVDKVRVFEHPNWTGFFNFNAGATTYGELVIVKRGHRSPSILKHELVHVCQYEKYGRQGFAHRYADQYVDSGFSYPNIFFERQAYDFQRTGTGPVSNLLKYCGGTGASSVVATVSKPLIGIGVASPQRGYQQLQALTRRLADLGRRANAQTLSSMVSGLSRLVQQFSGGKAQPIARPGARQGFAALARFNVGVDFDYYGGDYRSFRSDGRTFVPCLNACNSDGRCRAFTWQKGSGMCWLKRAALRRIRKPGYTTGSKK